MKCEAASMRRSAASHRSRAVATSPRLGGDAGERVEREDLDGRVVVAPGVVEDRDEPRLGAGDAVLGVERREQALAERGLLAAAGGAVPRGRRLERRARRRGLPERAQDAPEMHAGERRQPHVAGGLGLLDRELQRRGAGRVVAGLALRAAEAGDLVGLGLQEAEPRRRLRRAADVEDGIVEAVLEPGQLAEHRLAADVQPRVVDRLAASARPGRGPATARARSPAEIAARAAKSQFAAWSHGRSSPS